jgi:hypothetical protein
LETTLLITFVTEACDTPRKEADIENLLDHSVYDAPVNDTYKSELKDKKPALNPKAPVS